jgi:hypothetical protein
MVGTIRQDMKSIEIIIFLIWLGLVITWNYKFPSVSPFEDVFVTICLALFSRSLNKQLQ